MDQAPDRIGAYTFSRKAAGEIFDEILGYLLEAASSPEEAAQTSSRMGEDRSAAQFEQDLREVFQRLHRLRIGTLDSRIAQMLSAASVELGLPAEFAVFDKESPEYRRLQNRILNRLFGGGHSQEELDLFLQLFEEATHGKSEKSLFRELESFIANHRVSYLQFPDPRQWQGPSLEDPPAFLEPQYRDRLAQELREHLPSLITHKTLLKSLLAAVEACRTMEAGRSWSAHMPTSKVFGELLLNKEPVVHYGSKGFEIPADVYEGLQRLVDHACSVAVQEVQSRTYAMVGFLKVYEDAHRGQLLPSGNLAFEDACDLMSRFEDLTPAELAFRLDGEIDHWLLDEFQDTSQLQWNVLEPFLDEVRMDPEQGRSFFYVGDVKQAIYAWRGGDSHLFGHIQSEWPSLDVEFLNVSFRSSQTVLDLVNHLLTDIPLLEEMSTEGVQRWNQEFSPHTAARETLPGFAEVLQVTDVENAMVEAVVEAIQKLPEKRDIAILTKTNQEGRTYAEALRTAGIEVSLEGNSPVRDDTAVELVLAALRVAAHPGDILSKRLLQLCGLSIPSSTDLLVRSLEGMTPVVRSISQQIPLKPDAEFSRDRLEKLLNLAMEFDAQSAPSIDRFLAYIDQARLKEYEAKGMIRIMTIHQSKGLGFDAVIVPVSDSASLTKLRGGSLGQVEESPGEIRLSLLPPKDVCTRIPEYRHMLEAQEAEATYEALCVLYVALTRAKQHLQILLPAPPKKSAGSLSKTGYWIANRLQGFSSDEGEKGLLYRMGTPDFWTTEEEPISPEPELAFELPEGPPPLNRLEPSQADHTESSLEQYFIPISQDGRELGTLVHEVMFQVDWSDETELEPLLATHGLSLDSEAGKHVQTLMSLPELRKPSELVTLWREKKFESVMPEGWITGIFDRVVLFENGALLQDYKTNRYTGPETVEHYRPQMEMYREVLADMLQLPADNITCQLLFSGTGEVVTLT